MYKREELHCGVDHADVPSTYIFQYSYSLALNTTALNWGTHHIRMYYLSSVRSTLLPGLVLGILLIKPTVRSFIVLVLALFL